MFDTIKDFLLNQVLTLVVGIKKVADILNKVKDFLSGKKTYLIAASSIIGILVAYSQGSVNAQDAIKSIVEAVLAMTIRAGVSTSTKGS